MPKRTRLKRGMLVKPNLSYQFDMLSRKYPWALKKGRIYRAVHATNQPDWKKKGKIFVGEVLLEKGEYRVVRK